MKQLLTKLSQRVKLMMCSFNVNLVLFNLSLSLMINSLSWLPKTGSAGKKVKAKTRQPSHAIKARIDQTQTPKTATKIR